MREERLHELAARQNSKRQNSIKSVMKNGHLLLFLLRFHHFARLAKSIETSNCLCYYLYKVLYELISIVV